MPLWVIEKAATILCCMMSFYNIQKKNSLTEKSLMALLLLAKTCVCVCVCVCVGLHLQPSCLDDFT